MDTEIDKTSNAYIATLEAERRAARYDAAILALTYAAEAEREGSYDYAANQAAQARDFLRQARRIG
jgi:hypothetical protein